MNWNMKNIIQSSQTFWTEKKSILILFLVFFASNFSLLLFHLSEKNSFYLLCMLVSYGLLSFKIIENQYLFLSKDRTKLFILFCFYQGFSFFIGQSLHIPKLDASLIYSSLYPYIQTNYVIPFLLLVLFMFLILKWREESQFFSVQLTESDRLDKQLFLSQFFLSFVFSDTKVFQIIVDSQYILAGGNELTFSSLMNITILYIILAVGCYFFTKGLEKLADNSVARSSTWTMSLVLAILFNFFLQYSIKSADYFVPLYELQVSSFIFQVTILTLIFMLVYLVLNNFLLGTISIITLVTSFVFVNHLKFSMRQEPILPSDLGWLRQMFLLFGFVDIRQIFGLVLGIALSVAAYRYLSNKLWVGNSFNNLKERSILFLVISVFLFGTNQSVRSQADENALNIPVVTPLYKTLDIDWLGNTVNANVKSLSFVWIKQMVTPVMDRPDGYTKVNIDKIAEKYSLLADKINASRLNDIKSQTVIFVLSESFADPTRIPGTKASRELTPFIHSLQTNFPNGLMVSDGYGGGTANMEFQSLTGLAMYNMSPSVSTIYTEIATSMRFIPSVSDHFSPSRRIAIHLESGNNYSRNIIYKKLGFDQFIGTSNTDTIAKSIKNEGLYPSDASTYQYVLDSLTDVPQFYSVITMQNHVPWSAGLPEDIIVSNDIFDSEENESLTSFGRLLNRTDDATRDFFAQLSERDEKITVVFYGDHLPGLYKNENFEKDPSLQFKTDYFIWSNYQTEEKDWNLLRASDFVAALFETTDSKVSPYYALLTEVMSYSMMEEEQWTPEAQEVMEDFKLVEYDLLKSKGYLTKDSSFFKIGD